MIKLRVLDWLSVISFSEEELCHGDSRERKEMLNT
jgi:hypothetical protein